MVLFGSNLIDFWRVFVIALLAASCALYFLQGSAGGILDFFSFAASLAFISLAAAACLASFSFAIALSAFSFFACAFSSNPCAFTLAADSLSDFSFFFLAFSALASCSLAAFSAFLAAFY